jgi:uncharacterized delta-60 repeat protein
MAPNRRRLNLEPATTSATRSLRLRSAGVSVAASLQIEEESLPYIEPLESRVLFAAGVAAAAAAHRVVRAGSVDPRYVPPASSYLRLFGVRVQSSGRDLMFSPVGNQGATTISADQPDGTPDTQFNQNMAASLPANLSVDDFQVESDDKIVVFALGLPGSVGAPADVLRLNPDGTLDTSFGTDGVTPLPKASEVYSSAMQARVESGGQIVLLFGDDLMRLTPAGTLDPSFGTGGILQFASSSNPVNSVGLAVQPDGKVLLSAMVSDAKSDTQVPTMLRFNVDGTRNVTFGIGGQATLAPAAHIGDVSVGDLAVSPNGDIDFYVYYSGPLVSSHGYVEQLTTTGAIHLRFGNHGRASAALLSVGHNALGLMLVDAKGNIILASVQEVGYPSIGGVIPLHYATDYGGVLRLTPAGHRDPTFGNNGVRILDVGLTDIGNAQAQAWFYPPNGDIVAQVNIMGKGITTNALLDSRLRT